MLIEPVALPYCPIPDHDFTNHRLTLAGPCYHKSLSPNCSCRGALACPVMTPNDVEVTLVFGAENWTRLNAFSASTRNCAVTLGLTAKFLKNDRSKFCTPWALSTGEKIGSLPNVKAAVWL